MSEEVPPPGTMEDEADESWLYGNSDKSQAQQQQQEKDEDASQPAPEEDPHLAPPQDNEADKQAFGEDDNIPEAPLDESTQDGDQTRSPAPHSDKDQSRDGADMDDSDSDEDDINVVIGDIKSGPSYNIKQRGPLAVSGAVGGQAKQSSGKFSMEEFESVGTVNGVPAHEFSIDSLDEKPWRKPGADITDYFNYGFNEDTWRAYCERQKKFRIVESGVGLASLSQSVSQPLPVNGPPMRRGAIDVIGGGTLHSRRDMDPNSMKVMPVKENVIQVMTADRREYSRTQQRGAFGIEEPPPEPFYEEEPYNYMQAYEPTQDSQWGGNPIWGQPNSIKQLTPGPDHMAMPPPNMPMGMHGGIPMGGYGNSNSYHGSRGGYMERDRRDRHRDSDRDERRRDRDRDRERSHDRSERSTRSDRHARSESRRREKSRERSRTRDRSHSKEKSRKRSKSKDKKKSKKDKKDKSDHE